MASSISLSKRSNPAGANSNALTASLSAPISGPTSHSYLANSSAASLLWLSTHRLRWHPWPLPAGLTTKSNLYRFLCGLIVAVCCTREHVGLADIALPHLPSCAERLAAFTNSVSALSSTSTCARSGVPSGEHQIGDGHFFHHTLELNFLPFEIDVRRTTNFLFRLPLAHHSLLRYVASVPARRCLTFHPPIHPNRSCQTSYSTSGAALS